MALFGLFKKKENEVNGKEKETKNGVIDTSAYKYITNDFIIDVRNNFKDLYEFIKENTEKDKASENIKIALKNIRLGMDVLEDKTMPNDAKTAIVVELYHELFGRNTHGGRTGLSDYYVWDSDLKRRIKINSEFQNIQYKLKLAIKSVDAS